MKKSSINSRMDYAREHNQLAAFSKVHNATNPTPPPKIASDPWNIGTSKKTLEPEMKDGCICNRKHQIVVCENCKMLCYGRISQTCPKHPNVTYLLDLFYCPSCTCSRTFLKIKEAS
ncbi:uncharacterized protein LOC142221916 [Haematobia irritans]|uniref:uncharacterized protein LOC142221916 n=1 Tax=Haematobia irritans TaxID=7368 RepID=UPI003F507756